MSPWTPLLAAHAFAACTALPLGAYQILRRPKGDRRHRWVGWVWVVAMTFVAGSSFAVRDLRDGQLSLLHALSAITLVSLVAAIVSARRRKILSHRISMISSWLGLLGAFIGAVAVPARAIPVFVVRDLPGALLAVAATLLTAAVVVALASLLDRRVSGSAPAPA